MKIKRRPVEMTPRRIKNYLKRVYEVGRERNKTFIDFSAADFCAGAGVILEYLGAMDQMPAEWFFGLMLQGRNPFAGDKSV